MASFSLFCCNDCVSRRRADGNRKEIWNVLGEPQCDVLGALGVGKQVAVCSSLLKGIGVESSNVSSILSVSVVAVDDAGEVFVLVVARASELVHEVADRDKGHGHEESALSHSISLMLSFSLSLSLSRPHVTYSELLLFRVLDAAGGRGFVVGMAFCLLTSDCARSLRSASSEGLHVVWCVQAQSLC